MDDMIHSLVDQIFESRKLDVLAGNIMLAEARRILKDAVARVEAMVTAGAQAQKVAVQQGKRPHKIGEDIEAAIAEFKRR